jgi:hypothetical protein
MSPNALVVTHRSPTNLSTLHSVQFQDDTSLRLAIQSEPTRKLKLSVSTSESSLPTSNPVQHARSVVEWALGASTPDEAEHAEIELLSLAQSERTAVELLALDTTQPVDIRGIAARIYTISALSTAPKQRFSIEQNHWHSPTGTSKHVQRRTNSVPRAVLLLSHDSRVLVRLGVLEGAEIIKRSDVVRFFIDDANQRIREQARSAIGSSI